MKKLLLVLLIILGVVLASICFSYYILTKDDRMGAISSDGMNISHSANMEIPILSFNFVIAKDPEFVNIYYDVRSIRPNTTGLVAINIPYDGTLAVSDNWSANKSSTSDSTLIYRLFQCSNASPCTRDFNGQLAFIFSKDIDEKDQYHHSMQLNIQQSPSDSGILNIRDEVSHGVGNILGFTPPNDMPYTINFVLDDKFDKMSTLPQPDEQYPSSQYGMNTNVLQWIVKRSAGEFYRVEYENPDERVKWNTFEIIAIPIGIAIAIAVIIELIKSFGFGSFGFSFGSNENSREERRNHSRLLNEQVYKNMLNISPSSESGHRLEFNLTSFQYYEYAMEHIKYRKYKKILSHWNKANDLLKKYNSSVRSLEIQILTATVKEMNAIFPNFVEFRGDGRDNSYLTSNIIDGLFTIHQYGHNIQQIDLNPVNFGNNDHRILYDGLTIIQSPNPQELDIARCKRVLVSVYTTESIQTRFEKLDGLRQKINYEIEQFSTKLNDLVIKIEGGHMIEGKCGLEN